MCETTLFFFFSHWLLFEVRVSQQAFCSIGRPQYHSAPPYCWTCSSPLSQFVEQFGFIYFASKSWGIKKQVYVTCWMAQAPRKYAQPKPNTLNLSCVYG